MAILVQTRKSRQAVAGVAIVEGKAVKVSNSGLRNDLPTAALAAVNDVVGVYIAFMPPDNFPRPSASSWYTAPQQNIQRLLDDSTYTDPTETETFYRVPRSMWKQPTVPSGELVALHNGKIGVTAGAFIDVANIRIPGNMVRVGASGLLEYTATASEHFAVVDRYDPDNGVLYVDMDN
jgi:hypothetical protein